MTRRPLLLSVAAATTALVALAACSDKPAQPTAPRAPVQTAADAVVPGSGAALAGASTVCLAYSAKQSVAQKKLEEAQEAHASAEQIASIRSRAEKLDEIVADACN
jgi:hypothetical protein